MPKIIIILYEFIHTVLSNAVVSCIVGLISLLISFCSLRKVKTVESAVAETKRKIAFKQYLIRNKDSLISIYKQVADARTIEDFINAVDPVWKYLYVIPHIDSQYQKIFQLAREYEQLYYFRSDENLFFKLKEEITKLLSKIVFDIEQEGWS